MFEMEFTNFLPEDDLQDYGNSMLKRMMEQAPYAAAGRAFVELVNGQYKAQIIVKSESELFESSAQSYDCRQAMEKVEQQIYLQIARWRENRFKTNEIEAGDDGVVRPTLRRRSANV